MHGTFWSENLDTIIPEGLFENSYKCEANIAYGSFKEHSIKGVIPKEFLKNNQQVYIRQIFDNQNIIGVEKGWLTHSFKLLRIQHGAFYWGFENLFRGCEKLMYIPDDVAVNSWIETGLSMSLYGMFDRCPAGKPLLFMKNFSDYENLSYLFCKTKFTNESGEYDQILNVLCNGASITSTEKMFYECGLKRLPDSVFSLCTKINYMAEMFYNTPLENIPSMFLNNNRSVNCDMRWVFQNTKVKSIPNDFLRYAKVSNAYGMFSGCSELEGVIPSNFAVGGSGICVSFRECFYGCSKITGFENNMWNFSDFSKIDNLHSMFYKCSKLTSIPSAFCYKSFDSVTETINMFMDCVSLTSIPDGFMESCQSLTNASSTFNNCTALLNTPVDFMTNCPNLTVISNMFMSSSSMTGEIKSNFLNNSTRLINLSAAFRDCSNISGIESGSVFERIMSPIPALQELFQNCFGITSKLPELWSLYPDTTSKLYCFTNCTNAENYYKVPTAWGGLLNRTIFILEYGTSIPLQGVNVIVNGTSYVSDSLGKVIVRNGQASNVSISGDGYLTSTSSFPAITDAGYNTIYVTRVYKATFELRSTDGDTISGATIVLNGDTQFTDS